MIFALPWALAGLAALPALAAIYLLRTRSRRRTVSSLMLWVDLAKPREGGQRLERMQAPLLLLLELAILVLLALAAAGPAIRMAGTSPPITVVLDDSFSMLAGGDQSPQRKALAAVDEELRAHPDSSVQFILAGPQPEMLGDAVRGAPAARDLLKRWRCLSPGAALDAAVTLAGAVGGRRARILVLTDRKPQEEPAGGRVVWRALGRPLANVAIVNAARSSREGKERCLIEVANFSDEPRETTLAITDSKGASLARRTVTVPARQKAALFFDVSAGRQVLHAAIGDDALDLDNRVALVPPAPRPVEVALAIDNEPLRRSIQRAIQASGLARITTGTPDLLMTDRALPPLPEQAWSVQWIVDKEAEAYVGPFVLDRSHPLCEGLDLSGVIWAAASAPPLAGASVIAAGNVLLVTDSEGAAGRHDLRIRLKPDLSNLQDSPNWPALMWNTLKYRADHLSGVREPNVRLGADVQVAVAPHVRTVDVRSPGGDTQTRSVRDGRLAVRAEECGLYTVAAGAEQYVFAANALQPGESDLSAAATGDWGSWAEVTDAASEVRPVGWLALVAALGLLAAHLALVGRGSRSGPA